MIQKKTLDFKFEGRAIVDDNTRIQQPVTSVDLEALIGRNIQEFDGKFVRLKVSIECEEIDKPADSL